MAGESRAPELLVALSLILAALGLADLLAAVIGGFALVVAPIIGAAVGWIAHKKGARRLLALLAIGVNGLVLPPRLSRSSYSEAPRSTGR
jgi:predicted benzoate:H+ symporter BenE